MHSQPQSPMQQAVRKIDEFFRTRQAPQDVKNAWAQVKIDLITSKASPPLPAPTTSNAPIVAALEDIQGRLTLIEKRIPVLQDAAKPLSYADASRRPPPTHQAPSERFCPAESSLRLLCSLSPSQR